MKIYVNIAEVNASKSERARTRARASVCVCVRESDDAWAATSGGVKVEEGGGRETNK